MKNKIFRTIIAIFVISAAITIFCGCEGTQKDPCEGKICINCGGNATHFASGAKPTNGKANSKNSEKINASVYRLFYCDECYNGMPSVGLEP